MKKFLLALLGLAVIVPLVISQVPADRRPYAVEYDQLVGVTNTIQGQFNNRALLGAPTRLGTHWAGTNYSWDLNTAGLTNTAVMIYNASAEGTYGYTNTVTLPSIDEVPTGTIITVGLVASSNGLLATGDSDPFQTLSAVPTLALTYTQPSNTVYQYIYMATNILAIPD